MKIISLAAGLVLVAAIAGCASTSNTVAPHTTTAAPAADAQLECEPFSGTPAANPTPAPTPLGDPAKPATLAALQQQITQEAQNDSYSKQAVLCAEGQEKAQECNKDYWNFDGIAMPVPSVSCNFFYMRTADEYWTGLTPLVLAEYGDYLNVGADGKDPANAAAGPHTTISEIGGTVVTLPSISVPVSGGQLSGQSTASAITAVLPSGAATSSAGKNTITPVLAASSMKVSCDPVYYRSGSSGPWSQTALSQVPAKPGTKFWCTGDAGAEGTAYLSVTLGSASASGDLSATITIAEGGTKSTDLRLDPSGPFTSDNVVWPTGLPEVVNATPVKFSIPDGKGCVDGNSPVSCLHLWIVSAQKDANKNYTACKLWFTLELKSDELLSVMKKYGLSTSGYTPHISLAKSPNLKGADAATYCGRADRLNSGVGLAGSGAPPEGLA